MYLIDTNVISAGSLAQRKVPSELIAWMERQSDALYLSVVTIAEIEDGISKTRREGAVRKARDLTAWLEALLHLYSARILAFDIDVARIAGILSDRARGHGHAPGFADIVIAATAEHRHLTILTRNLKHFEPLGAKVIDPFETLPLE